MPPRFYCFYLPAHGWFAEKFFAPEKNFATTKWRQPSGQPQPYFLL